MKITGYYGDVVVVTEWQQGDSLSLICPLCGEKLTQVFSEENREDILHNDIVECPCGKKGWQILR